MCQKIFGNGLHAMAMPLVELEISGELAKHTIVGGTGIDPHYNFCPQYDTFIFITPDLLDLMVYLLAGLLDGQIEFIPTVELCTVQKPSYVKQAFTTKAAFEDNCTT